MSSHSQEELEELLVTKMEYVKQYITKGRFNNTIIDEFINGGFDKSFEDKTQKPIFTLEFKQINDTIYIFHLNVNFEKTTLQYSYFQLEIK
jgi:hypothetical protein